MLKAGSIILTLWCGINFLLAALILTSVVLFNANSPLLVMVFNHSEIANLEPRAISALNALTILYNSCAVAVSLLVLFIIRSQLIHREKRAFRALLFTIGFVELMAFIGSAQVANARWQVNVVLSVLYVVGIGLTSYALFRRSASDLGREPTLTPKMIASESRMI